MTRVPVSDAQGQQLSPCDAEKAKRLVANGQAVYANDELHGIRLNITIARTPAQQVPAADNPRGEPLLLHLCCGPCATYTSSHLQAQGWQVTGYWYNPNIEPLAEYALRRASLERLSDAMALPLIWDDAAGDDFRRAILGYERTKERCALCYRLRLQRTAHTAAMNGFRVISTSLLISPYQDLQLINSIGTEVASQYGLRFLYENMRSGYNERTRLSREYGLYLQAYCGCSFSAQTADTRRQARAHRITGIVLVNQ